MDIWTRACGRKVLGSIAGVQRIMTNDEMVRMVGEGEQTLWYHSTRWSQTVEKGSISEELIAGLMWYNTVHPEPNLPPSLTPVGEDRPLL